MAEAVKPRVVSGEIMASTASTRSSVAERMDVVEAEFETVEGEGPFGTRPNVSLSEAGQPALGMDTLKGAVATPRKPAPGGPLFWSFGLALAACAFWVSGGHALVRMDPSPLQAIAEPANVLRIVDVTSSVAVSGGRRVLNVDGAAINEGAGPALLPGIEIAVTGGNGRLTRYNLGTSDRPLPGGERFVFSSRLEVPKDGVKSVSVRFRGNANAGGEGQGH